ncbi:MAG: hypothetical protein O8C63_03660 [Candidatus Methanoperedens sp.]|nr:hypothetical protein [Candidatus Methanoperedens sp.]
MWSKQKTKLQINIFLIAFLIFSTAISGCIKTPSDSSVIPEVSTQNINGDYKVQDISGQIIRINGQYNEIRIINKDVSEIWINGQYNIIYYPKEAHPLIKENGLGNEIKTY